MSIKQHYIMLTEPVRSRRFERFSSTDAVIRTVVLYSYASLLHTCMYLLDARASTYSL